MTTQTDGRSLIFDLGGQHPVVVNLDEDEDNDSDGTLLGDEFEERFVRPTPEVVFIRSQPLATPPDDNTKRLDSYAHEGRTYKPGKTIELLSGAFLRITAIVHSPHDQSVCLKGLMFRRNSALDGLFERQRNEVTMNLDYDDADPRDIYHQSTKVTQLSEVVRIRDLIKTNQPFPVASFREMDTRRDIHGLGKDFILNHGRLVCRYKQVITSRTEGYLEVLAEDEADVDWGMDPRELRCHFRGETERGGMCRRWLDGEREFDHCERLNRGTSRRHGSLPTDTMDLDSPELVDMTGNEPNIRNRRYTIGDAFCGAGGASRGAKVAGLRVDWGFDFDRAAIDSYQRNFYTTRCEGIAAHEFVTVINENFQVDVLHLSPPCQTFSPIHVHRGQNDEINEATFLATAEIIKKVKPRIVTLEETFGLTRTVDNLQWFEALIQMFTKLGFSVRWKVFNLCDFGLPQPRKRLYILASCPGESLPEFPKPTHCKAADLYRFPHLSRFATVNDAIARIPTHASHHNPNQLPRRNERPYDANLPLRNTICCAGNFAHPSGQRSFTLRELACLQGFPIEHQFGPTRTRKQIGNAVPPVVAKVFFETIRKALLKADGLA